VLLMVCVSGGFLFTQPQPAHVPPSLNHHHDRQQRAPSTPEVEMALRGIRTASQDDVDFSLQIAQLLSQIESKEFDLAADSMKNMRSEWKPSAEASALQCLVSWERGRKKKARKACRQALNSHFRIQHWNGKHLAYNAVSVVFEKMEEPGAAINAARLAVNFANSAETEAEVRTSFQTRLVQLLWKRGACADMTEVVKTLESMDNTQFGEVLQQTLMIAQKTFRHLCSFYALPTYVQQAINHPELMILSQVDPNNFQAKQFRNYLQLSKFGHFSPGAKSESPVPPMLDGTDQLSGHSLPLTPSFASHLQAGENRPISTFYRWSI